jgi:hypothetical protein
MVSMSYCRFRNTLQEIENCLNALDEREHISENEQEAAQAMFYKIITWLHENDVIVLDDNDSPYHIDEILEQCTE